MRAGGPATTEIFQRQNPYAGFATNPTPSMGISGPNVPYVSWAPRGATQGQTDPAAFLKYGEAPTVHGHVQIKGLDFIQHTYLMPPWGDGESEKYIGTNMLVFTLNALDGKDGSTIILTVPKLNQLMHDAYVDFESFSRPNDPDFYPEAAAFKRYLEHFGEGALEYYHYARKWSPEKLEQMRKDLEKEDMGFSELQEFYAMAFKDVFCWLTKLGITQKVSFSGSVINRSGDNMDDESRFSGMSHYYQVNVCVAKRWSVSNIFGTADNVTTGSKLWINLKRKVVQTRDGIQYREFQAVPFGSKTDDYPSRTSVHYVDPSGRTMFGHTWKVGVVIQPGKFSPQIANIKRAANVGHTCNERIAFDEHATLPLLYVAIGFKQ